MKRYRFFFHYRKQTGRMSVHYRGECLDVKNVVCFRPCETKWNKRQPLLVVQGTAIDVKVEDDTAVIY